MTDDTEKLEEGQWRWVRHLTGDFDWEPAMIVMMMGERRLRVVGYDSTVRSSFYEIGPRLHPPARKESK